MDDDAIEAWLALHWDIGVPGVLWDDSGRTVHDREACVAFIVKWEKSHPVRPKKFTMLVRGIRHCTAEVTIVASSEEKARGLIEAHAEAITWDVSDGVEDFQIESVVEAGPV